MRVLLHVACCKLQDAIGNAIALAALFHNCHFVLLLVYACNCSFVTFRKLIHCARSSPPVPTAPRPPPIYPCLAAHSRCHPPIGCCCNCFQMILCRCVRNSILSLSFCLFRLLSVCRPISSHFVCIMRTRGNLCPRGSRHYCEMPAVPSTGPGDTRHIYQHCALRVNSAL